MVTPVVATLTLWHALQQGPVLDTFNEIIKDYNQQHPNQHVEALVQTGSNPSFVDYGAPAKQALLSQKEQRPDLVLAPEYQTSMMQKALKDRIALSISEFLSPEILSRIADIVRYTFGDENGMLSSLPVNPSCGILYANASLVTKKEMPETLEQLITLCKKLIEAKRVENGWTTAWPAAYLGEIPAAQRNIALASPDNGKKGYGQYQLGTNKFFYEHCQTLRQLQRELVFLYAGQTNEASKPFLQGKAAFFTQGAGHAPLLQSQANFPILVAPLPTLSLGLDPKEKSPPPLGGTSLWVLDKERTQEMVDAVKSFATYLASDEVQIKWHKATACVPVLKDLDQQLEEFYKDHPAHEAVVRQTLKAHPAPNGLGIHMPNWTADRKELFNLFEKVLGIQVHTDEKNQKTFTVSDKQLSEDEVQELLNQFDKKYSIAQPSE